MRTLARMKFNSKRLSKRLCSCGAIDGILVGLWALVNRECYRIKVSSTSLAMTEMRCFA